MLDPLESFVRNHFISTRWNEDRYYSNMAASARAVLDFAVPDGIQFKLGKDLSRTFRSSYLWGIVPDRKSFGVIYANLSQTDGGKLRAQPAASTRSITEDMETRLGLSWTEAVRQYERMQRTGNAYSVDERNGQREGRLVDRKTTSPSLQQKDAGHGGGGWSWERMVSLATGQPSAGSAQQALSLTSSTSVSTSAVKGAEPTSPVELDVSRTVADTNPKLDPLAIVPESMIARGTKPPLEIAPPPLSPSPAKRAANDSLLYGQIFQDGSIDFLWSERLDRNWLAVASGKSTWRIANSQIRAQVMYSPSEAVCSELSYDSDGQIIGWSSMASFRSPFGEGNAFSKISFGGELYYAAKEKTGGLSLGFRLRQFYPQFRASPLIPIHSTFTTLLNPMMGHVSMAYVSTVRHGMDVACRYDLNLYSQESDMSLGVEYAPANSEQIVKARWTLGEGLAFLLEGKWNGALVALGLNIQLRGPGGTSSWDKGFVSATPKLGIQVQI